MRVSFQAGCQNAGGSSLLNRRFDVLTVRTYDVLQIVCHFGCNWMLLLGKDTRMRIVGEKRLVLVSSRVRKDDTLSVEFDTSEQRRSDYATLNQWVALAVLLQCLTCHENISQQPNSTGTFVMTVTNNLWSSVCMGINVLLN